MNMHQHDTIDREVRYLPQPAPRRRGMLAQFGLGLWDTALRLTEFFAKLFLASVVVLALIVVLALVGWHYLEKGVDWLGDQTTPTTTQPVTTTTP